MIFAMRNKYVRMHLVEIYDSGGPLFMIIETITYNIGIVSYGIACATKTPAANTRLTYYLDWIMSQTKSTVYCIK